MLTYVVFFWGDSIHNIEKEYIMESRTIDDSLFQNVSLFLVSGHPDKTVHFPFFVRTVRPR